VDGFGIQNASNQFRALAVWSSGERVWRIFSGRYMTLLDVARQVNLWWALDKVAFICERPPICCAMRLATAQLGRSRWSIRMAGGFTR